MKKAIIAILLAIVTTTSFAEKAETKSNAKAENKSEAAAISLSGNVIDQVSGEALVGVEVQLAGSQVKTYTDFDGHFVIQDLKPGDYKLVASYTSYKKNEKTYTLDSKVNQVKIELQVSK